MVKNYLEKISGLNLLLFGLIIRILTLAVIQYGERINNIPLTDVDYFVFSDAASFVRQGLSPYLRHTYRYTPLLAWLLIPGYNFPLFGKIIFILFDWASACLIYKNFGKGPTAFYLFNPLTIGIAARGNAESIIVFVCLLALVTKDYWWLSGPLLALAVHLKTYPAPWALTIWLYLAGKQNRILTDRKLPWSLDGICYGIVSFISFSILTFLSYYYYAEEFLEHAHLHHLTRQDTRHNFSIWFLSFYILDGKSAYSSLCFISQLALFIITSIKYYNEVYFAAFLHAAIFVTFNKVVTSQYFIWYISLIPPIWNNFQTVKPTEALMYTSAWFVGQGIWLLPAYYLEMCGFNSFIWLHLGSIIHFATNIFCLSFLVKNFTATKPQKFKMC